jgi:hypothetical protein
MLVGGCRQGWGGGWGAHLLPRARRPAGEREKERERRESALEGRHQGDACGSKASGCIHTGTDSLAASFDALGARYIAIAFGLQTASTNVGSGGRSGSRAGSGEGGAGRAGRAGEVGRGSGGVWGGCGNKGIPTTFHACATDDGRRGCDRQHGGHCEVDDALLVVLVVAVVVAVVVVTVVVVVVVFVVVGRMDGGEGNREDEAEGKGEKIGAGSC